MHRFIKTYPDPARKSAALFLEMIMKTKNSTQRELMITTAVALKDKKGPDAVRKILNDLIELPRQVRLHDVPPSKEAEVIAALEKELNSTERKTTMPSAIAAPYGENQRHVVHGAGAKNIYPGEEITKAPINSSHRHARKEDIRHRSPEMSPYTIGLPGDLDPETTALVLDTANLMGQKLLKSQVKFSANWSLPGWAEADIRYQAFKHVLKGDPIDVMNYMAFLSFHGKSVRPANREEAMAMAAMLFEAFPAEEAEPQLFVNVEGIKVDSRESAQELVKVLQKKYDLIDDNAILRELMDKMEERHGEEFNAFFEATLRQIMIGSGMTELHLDTAGIMQTLIIGGTLVMTEAPGKIIYRLAGENDQIEYDAAGNFVRIIKNGGDDDANVH
jgi:hypothetical protein